MPGVPGEVAGRAPVGGGQRARGAQGDQLTDHVVRRTVPGGLVQGCEPGPPTRPPVVRFEEPGRVTQEVQDVIPPPGAGGVREFVAGPQERRVVVVAAQDAVPLRSSTAVALARGHGPPRSVPSAAQNPPVIIREHRPVRAGPGGAGQPRVKGSRVPPVSSTQMAFSSRYSSMA